MPLKESVIRKKSIRFKNLFNAELSDFECNVGFNIVKFKEHLRVHQYKGCLKTKILEKHGEKAWELIQFLISKESMA